MLLMLLWPLLTVRVFLPVTAVLRFDLQKASRLICKLLSAADPLCVRLLKVGDGLSMLGAQSLAQVLERHFRPPPLR